MPTSQRTKSELPVYHKNTLEFVAVAKSYCDLMEQLEDMNQERLVDTATKLLPLLYLKASLLPESDPVSEEEPETFATEDQYQELVSVLSGILGNQDAYLDVFHPDIQLSDTPVANFISENLADIWQDMYNFISVFRIGYEETMNDALHNCRANFRHYWGQSLVNVLRALHRCKYSDEEQDASEEIAGEEDFI
jgi:hypothetical protein